MKRLSYLLILIILLTGCVKLPDSFSVSPIMDKNKEICTFTDFIDTIYGGILNFKWEFDNDK
jgi:PBP1b-binding outer membrane lipoprotein LpoB